MTLSAISANRVVSFLFFKIHVGRGLAPALQIRCMAVRSFTNAVEIIKCPIGISRGGYHPPQTSDNLRIHGSTPTHCAAAGGYYPPLRDGTPNALHQYSASEQCSPLQGAAVWDTRKGRPYKVR